MQGAFGIIFRNNNKEVLLVKRRDMPIWVLPGGGLEHGESPEQTTTREVYEETGYEVVINRKVGEYRYHGSNKINYTFVCIIQGGVQTLSRESKAIEYFDITKLPDMMSPFARVMIEDALCNRTNIVKFTFEKLPASFWIKGLLHPWVFFKYLLTRVGIHWNT